MTAFYIQRMPCLLFISLQTVSVPECCFPYSMWLQSNGIEITYSGMQSVLYMATWPLTLTLTVNETLTLTSDLIIVLTPNTPLSNTVSFSYKWREEALSEERI